MSRDQQVISAGGVLAEFNRAGVLGQADLQIAQTTARLIGATSPTIVLAMALAVRQLRAGSACVDLTTIAADTVAELTDPGLDDEQLHPEVSSLPWPDPTTWITELAGSGQIADATTGANVHPFRLSGNLLYLERWWSHEQAVATALASRAGAEPPAVDTDLLEQTLAELFTGAGLDGEPDLQAQAARTATVHWTSVIAGGPGTGKTTTVAKLLATLNRVSGAPLTVALAAPSGKAATRLEGSVREEAALNQLDLGILPRGITVHRLLGYHGAGGGFTRSAANPLAEDVVVVDEVSMLDLPLFAQLVSSLRPTTRLIMVGDPNQLSSVDAGKVLADLALAARTGSRSSRPISTPAADIGAVPSEPAPDAADSRQTTASRPGSGAPEAGWPGSDAATLTAVEGTGTSSGAAAGPSGAELTRAQAAPTGIVTPQDRTGQHDGERRAAPSPVDVQQRPTVAMVELLRNWRNEGGIARVASHIRAGDADAVMAELRAGGDGDLLWVDQATTGLYVPEDLATTVRNQGAALFEAAQAGEADRALQALDQHRILCAHREGRFGVSVWSRWAFDLLRAALPGYGTGGEWYLGRPILAGINNREIDVSNGDAGVIVATPTGPRLALPTAQQARLLAPSLVDGLSSLYAMTVHKSQGSQFTDVTVVLPPAESALLTRELLYTAVTRAKKKLRILGGEAAIRAAVERGTQRVSGLVDKLI